MANYHPSRELCRLGGLRLPVTARDDIPLAAKGEPVDPKSIIQLSFRGNRPIFPEIKPILSDEFLKKIHLSGGKWIILVDQENESRLAMDSDEFIRDALFNPDNFNPYYHCHRHIIAKDDKTTIGNIISLFQVKPSHRQDDVVDQDVILLWGEEKHIITGADIRKNSSRYCPEVGDR